MLREPSDAPAIAAGASLQFCADKMAGGIFRRQAAVRPVRRPWNFVKKLAEKEAERKHCFRSARCIQKFRIRAAPEAFSLRDVHLFAYARSSFPAGGNRDAQI
jgi:hypothetical protein